VIASLQRESYESMMYLAYQAMADVFTPIRYSAQTLGRILTPASRHLMHHMPLRAMNAACGVVASSGLTHARPAFHIRSVLSGGREQSVTEEVVYKTPFCNLLHFAKPNGSTQPRVLVLAPMSGHFATLLRATVQTLLRDHDVYITDWLNIRDVPLYKGRFDLHEYIAHVIEFFGVLGPDSHLVAVCQPCVPGLAAVAVMAQEHNPAQPKTMTLMAGPIDTRINPTAVNDLATTHPIEWFERRVVSTVPLRFKGAMRRVYPGFLQISAFMSMNPVRHMHQFIDLYHHLFSYNDDDAEHIQDFYEEYFAMMDLPAEFYLQTVQEVFQEYRLARGEFYYRGEKVDPAAIKRTALFTVEGERDDICSLGQTLAAQDLCSGLRPYMKVHHVQTGVGHYGVFSGRRWDNEVYPRVRDHIYAFS